MLDCVGRFFVLKHLAISTWQLAWALKGPSRMNRPTIAFQGAFTYRLISL
jgi:hypothetical protein